MFKYCLFQNTLLEFTVKKLNYEVGLKEGFSDSKVYSIHRLILLSTIKIIICTLQFPDPNLIYASNDRTRATP